MNRYLRNINVIGSEGQKRLSEADVFIIGCGALGGQVAMLLAVAGVGHIGIADFDTVDVTNLQRQLFFEESDAGCRKSETLARRMRALNSGIRVDVHVEMLRDSNADRLLDGYGFVVDATDNPASKYMIDDICLRLGLPACIGGVAGWRGQVTCVRGKTGEENVSMRFADYFPRPYGDPEMLPCMIEGVMGPAASVIASVQAAEVLKYLSGNGEPAFNRLFTIDLATLRTDLLEF